MWISSQSYTIGGGTYSFHDVVMRGGAIVVIPPGESMKIYLSGTLDMGGNISINNRGIALPRRPCCVQPRGYYEHYAVDAARRKRRLFHRLRAEQQRQAGR